MATPRRLLVDPATSGVFHCVSRCVRRAFLCGWDAYSGRDYDHRRFWIRGRLRELTVHFAIEVHAYAVMTNHLHVVVRTLPEQTRAWDDEEVARRWLTLFPGPDGTPGQAPGDSAIRSLCQDSEKLAICRERLADLSWFMRCLNEPIARRANREDECTGRFWEGRFKCQRLEDEGAVLACMAYVDLNPVRAGMADCPEQSELTSGQDRILARQARRQLARAPEHPTPPQVELLDVAKVEAKRDEWLAPLGPTPSPVGPGERPNQQNRSEPPKGVIRPPASRLQSVIETPSPLLRFVNEEDYLELLDWTGREIRADKRGTISPNLRPMLERFDLNVEAWVENVESYGGLFYRLAGKLELLRERAASLGRTWLHGHRGADRLYAVSADGRPAV